MNRTPHLPATAPAYKTAEERRTLGRIHRKQMARQAHAMFAPQPRRLDPLRLLQASMQGRVPSLVQIKYQRMLVSPFGFFRGAVPVMAYDLSLLPNSGIINQMCGDAHVRNLGAYAAPDGRLVFDINDFDETIRGPFEWDVKRLAASILLAGREARAGKGACADSTRAFLARYRKTIQMLSQLSVLEIARWQVHRLHAVTPVSEVLLEAQRATPLHTLEQITEPLHQRGIKPARQAAGKNHLASRGKSDSGDTAEDSRVFMDRKPLQTRVGPAQARQVLASLRPYRETLLPERQHFLDQYRPVDVAFKVVGTGSVGLRDYIVYCEGNSPRDPLFLQIKEEPASAWAPYLADAPQGHQGKRAADGQRAMQLQSDPFLGWTSISSRDYLVRQLNDHKGSVDMTVLKGKALLEYAEVCGELLARGHARSGDALVLSGYLGTSPRFDEAIFKFALEYADQTERDWERLVQSRKPGKATGG